MPNLSPHVGVAAVDVVAVVVSYNARDYLARCVEELTERGLAVVVVDNASQDDSANLVRRRFPHATLVELSENRGFGAAANEGMRWARGRYYLILNADAWPADDAVEKLVAIGDRCATAGVIVPLLRAEDGRAQRSVFALPSVRFAVLSWVLLPGVLSSLYARARGLVERIVGKRALASVGPDHRMVSASRFVIGAALLLRAEAADDVGGFDPRFFMFNEDADLCVRMQHAGWSVVYVPQAEFLHVGGASTRSLEDEMFRERIRSQLRFVAKHSGHDQAERLRRVLIVSLKIRGFFPRRRAASDAARWLSMSSLPALLTSHE